MSKFMYEDILDVIFDDLNVAKHGDHDQASHGNWSTGLSEETVSSIKNFTRDWGGLSIKMSDGSMPTKGYMVAKPPSFGRVVSKEDFYDKDKGFEILRDYMRTHKEDLATGKHYLGTWEHEGKVYLDVSQNIMDETEATSLGRERNQIEIWDVANQKTINTGGTGSVEKRSKDGGTQGHLNDDRGRDGRLRKRDVGKTLKVIRFDYGLKPIFKHEGGPDHEQVDHGNWARGFTESEISRIKAMDRVGPSIDDIKQIIKPEVTDKEIELTVRNDSELYAQATEDIDFRVEERLAALQAEFPLHEYTEAEKLDIYDRIENDMIETYIENERDSLTDNINANRMPDLEDVRESFNEVYSHSKTGKGLEGDEKTLTSEITNVQKSTYGDELFVSGQITDENGDLVGEFQRRFFERNGVMNVEHVIFEIYGDENKGTGFGKEFIQRQEDWYTAKGLGTVEVGTAWDGARHWARAGYDWKPDKVSENLSTIAQRVADIADEGWLFQEGSRERIEFDSIMSRATNGYVPNFQDESKNTYPAWDSVKDIKSDDFPLPAEFANIGYEKGAKDWAGKDMMYDLRLKYVKVLTAEGQKLMDGPIDHDGDGMIYDGTAREKPAPSSAKN